VFERYYRELLSFLSRKVSDRATAADLAQESYARVYEAQRTGSVVRDPRALLYRTARNLVTDHHRRTGVRAGFDGAAPDEGAVELDDCIGPATFEPDTILSSGQGLAAMVATIDRLPPRCREAFVLYKFDGLSYAEVAERMGISVRTVEMQLRIAMDACWACLDEVNGGSR
jgi:RNA polymerase sigma factor (sigma-70 family)